ncbi:hypothetical protein [Plantactinospora sp. GCM10030261]
MSDELDQALVLQGRISAFVRAFGQPGPVPSAPGGDQHTRHHG